MSDSIGLAIATVAPTSSRQNTQLQLPLLTCHDLIMKFATPKYEPRDSIVLPHVYVYEDDLRIINVQTVSNGDSFAGLYAVC